MRTLASLSLALVLSSCASGVYSDRYGASVMVSPEWWGTVTYVDPYARRIDFDYIDGGVHYVRPVYYARHTRWDSGLAFSTVHAGDRLWIRGRANRGGHWQAEHVRRY
jgi:hypothetical protein